MHQSFEQPFDSRRHFASANRFHKGELETQESAAEE
jgi:hypothetical protein